MKREPHTRLRCRLGRVREADPPAGDDWIECVLLTSVADGLSLRWLVEENHKCLERAAPSSSADCSKRIGWSRASA